MAPFESLGTVCYLPTIVTMALSSIVLEIKWDIGRKSCRWFFHTPLAFEAPSVGFPSEYYHTVWYGKTRMVGLPNGEKTLMTCCAISTEYQHVTSGQTSCYSILRITHMCCVVMNWSDISDFCNSALAINCQGQIWLDSMNLARHTIKHSWIRCPSINNFSFTY